MASMVEKAWMMSMAHEMARRYQEEREKGTFGPQSGQEHRGPPPPAYARY